MHRAVSFEAGRPVAPRSRQEWEAAYAASSARADAPNPVLVELVDGLAPGTALDLGAGEGRHALWLGRQGWAVTAVDFSAAALARAGRLAAELGVELHLEEADVVSYRPPAAGFDLVTVVQLHLAPAERPVVLERAAAALAPGGHLLVLDHDVVGRPGIGPEPARRLSPELVAASLAGLEVERCGRVEVEVSAPAGPLTTTFTLGWARRPSLAPGRRAGRPAG